MSHTFATQLVNAGCPITAIQQLLGHVWVTTTQNYVAANDARVKADFIRAAALVESWQ